MTLKKASAALLVASLVQGCATYNPNDHYDPNATVEIGTVVNRVIKTHVTEARADNQTFIAPVGSGAVGAIAGALVESGNGSAQIPIYEYQVKTENDTMVFVTSRFAGHKNGDCVKVFQSSSPRPDYPRMASGSGCSK